MRIKNKFREVTRSFARVVTCALLMASLCRCAAFSGEYTMQVESNPAGADVVTPKGEALGKTPLTLKPEQLARLGAEGQFGLVVKKPGYVPRQMVARLSGISKYEVMLQPMEKEFFEKEVLSAYGPELSGLVREVLELQGLLALKKKSEAETAFDRINKKFGGIAAVSVLGANLYLQQGRRKDAEVLLQRAAQMDPSDNTIRRLMLRLRSDRSTAGSKP